MRRKSKWFSNILRTTKFKIGYVPYGGYFYDLSLFENLSCRWNFIKNQRDRIEKINYLTSKFDLESIRDIKAKFYQAKKKLVIAMAFLETLNYFIRWMFCSLDVMTIKMLQQIIVNLQSENKNYNLYMWSGKDLLMCRCSVVLSDGKVIAKGTLRASKNPNAQSVYFMTI